MNHVAFHLSEKFITEDLEYYFSGERDKNNQVRPDKDICSMTPGSALMSHELDAGHVTNFFYPSHPNLVDKIYIGTSVPLFANNWGASFLLQLLKIIKPGGAIILPVYPEGQAQEKSYWSRSFLENIFLSRQRWTGFSNIIAENDGVMSLQVGRNWPAPIPSTIEWFYQQRSTILLQELRTTGSSTDIQTVSLELIEKVWNNYMISAVMEKIISDHYAAKTPLTMHNVSDDYGLLVTELLLSPHSNIVSGITTDVSRTSDNVTSNFNNYFAPLTGTSHRITTSDITEITFQKEANIISMINVLSDLDESSRETLLDNAWKKIHPGGLLIVYEDLTRNNQRLATENLNALVERFGVTHIYSSIAASMIHKHTDISHYSSTQEAMLMEEKHNQDKVFRVVKKNHKD